MERNALSQAGEKSAAQTALPKWAWVLEVWGPEREAAPQHLGLVVGRNRSFPGL